MAFWYGVFYLFLLANEHRSLFCHLMYCDILGVGAENEAIELLFMIK